MPKRKFTEEQRSWLSENYPNMTNAEMAQAWPWRDEPMSVKAIRSYGNKRHLKKADRGRAARKYTDEQREWLRGYIPGHDWHEISSEFERLYGSKLTRCMVSGLRESLGVRSGTDAGHAQYQTNTHKGKKWDDYMPKESQERARATQFKPGVLHGAAKEQVKPLLSIREVKDGYLQIKVSPRNAKSSKENWISLAKFEWMGEMGRDWPDGCVPVFVDGNNRNFDVDNIVPVPKDVYLSVMNGMNGHGIDWFDRETLEVAIAHTRLCKKVRRMEGELPRTCEICGRTYFLTDEERGRTMPPRTCRECRNRGRRATPRRQAR